MKSSFISPRQTERETEIMDECINSKHKQPFSQEVQPGKLCSFLLLFFLFPLPLLGIWFLLSRVSFFITTFTSYTTFPFPSLISFLIPTIFSLFLQVLHSLHCLELFLTSSNLDFSHVQVSPSPPSLPFPSPGTFGEDALISWSWEAQELACIVSSCSVATCLVVSPSLFQIDTFGKWCRCLHNVCYL